MSTSRSPPSTRSGHSGPANDEKQTYDVHTVSPAADPAYEAELQAVAPRLRGRTLTAALAFVAGTGFTLFGCVSYTVSISVASILTGPVMTKVSCLHFLPLVR